MASTTEELNFLLDFISGCHTGPCSSRDTLARIAVNRNLLPPGAEPASSQPLGAGAEIGDPMGLFVSQLGIACVRARGKEPVSTEDFCCISLCLDSKRSLPETFKIPEMGALERAPRVGTPRERGSGALPPFFSQEANCIGVHFLSLNVSSCFLPSLEPQVNTQSPWERFRKPGPR